eukprot:843254-Rhodomonas_salina.1
MGTGDGVSEGKRGRGKRRTGRDRGAKEVRRVIRHCRGVCWRRELGKRLWPWLAWELQQSRAGGTERHGYGDRPVPGRERAEGVARRSGGKESGQQRWRDRSGAIDTEHQ